MTDSGNGYQVVMPRLGLTMTEGKLVEWHKQEGETVAKGELLFTLESEKAALEIEAPASGVLHILVPVGETVPVNQPIAVIGARPTTDDRRPEAAPSTVTRSGPSSRAVVKASPKARALARQKGLALEAITGTGPRGMIVSVDLAQAGAPAPMAAIKATPVARKVAAEAGVDLATLTGTGPRGQITRQDVERAMAKDLTDFPTVPVGGNLSGLTGLRAIIAERLSAGWRERPQVTLTTEADATNLVSARQQVIAELGEKISYDAFMVMLVARALREHPHVNATLTEAGIAQLADVNIGVAVDTERGLLVPVVRKADAMSLIEINRTLRDLGERASAGRSLPDDLTGGTFTITNLGMYEIDAFTPIINPPECAILGVGRIVSRPVGLNGQVVLREMLALSLSFDHRLIDGAPGYSL